MRKILPLVLVAALGTASYAQNRSSKATNLMQNGTLKNVKAVPARLLNNETTLPINRAASKVVRPVSTTQAKSTSVVTEAKVGSTFYDLQTNASISNRFLRHPDGTMSVAWTTSPTSPGTGPDRGTGYNYWDGSAWTTGLPNMTRTESVRTGFTNIIVTASGHEMSPSHSSTQTALNLCYRPTKGTGAWTDGTALGLSANNTWTKGIAGGANGESVHIICQGTGVSGVPINGQDGPLYYFRSTDGGVTFPIVDQPFAFLDATDNSGFGGDGYSIDAKGDVIAIAVGDFTTNLYLLKSLDNGDNWTKTTIVQSGLPQPWDDTQPYPDLNGDTYPDTLELPGGDAHVMIDNNNMCHVWWSTVLCVNDDGTGTGYFPNALDGLYYWNETMATGAGFVVAYSPELDPTPGLTIPSTSAGDGNGVGGYRGSMTQMPSSGIDAAGNLYVCYMALNELADTSVYTTGHKHTYVIKSMDNGATWTAPNAAYNIVQDANALYEDGVFGCMAKHVDTDVYILYQRDEAPGHSLSTNATVVGWNSTESDQIVAKFPVGDIPTGITAPASSNSSQVQIMPNPATDYVQVHFNLSSSSDVAIEVTDVIGKLVYSQVENNTAAGKHQITLSTKSLNKGLYFYSVIVNGEKSTQKIVVE